MKNLKALREGAGLSQERLGELVGVSRFAIMDYENGRSSPTYSLSKKLAELFQCQLPDLDDVNSNPQFPPQVGGGEAMTA